MKKFPKVSISRLKAEIIRQETDFALEMLRDGNRTTSEHKKYLKELRRVRGLMARDVKDIWGIYDFLDAIGFDQQGATDYLFELLVDWKK